MYYESWLKEYHVVQYKAQVHTSENLCDFPWKLLGVVSTVGCSALHKNSTQIVIEDEISFTSTTSSLPICVGCCDVHRVLASIERFLGFYENTTGNGHHGQFVTHVDRIVLNMKFECMSFCSLFMRLQIPIL